MIPVITHASRHSDSLTDRLLTCCKFRVEHVTFHRWRYLGRKGRWRHWYVFSAASGLAAACGGRKCGVLFTPIVRNHAISVRRPRRSRVTQRIYSQSEARGRVVHNLRICRLHLDR
jgi:hypothetical protein